MTPLRCNYCNAIFDELPLNAKPVGNPRGSMRLYEIDGRIHELGSVNLGRKKSAVTPQEKQK
jgi:hypothetical protein